MYLAIAAATWFFLTPPLATMRNFEVGWIAFVLGRNFGLTVVISARGTSISTYSRARDGLQIHYAAAGQTQQAVFARQLGP